MLCENGRCGVSPYRTCCYFARATCENVRVASEHWRESVSGSQRAFIHIIHPNARRNNARRNNAGNVGGWASYWGRHFDAQ